MLRPRSVRRLEADFASEAKALSPTVSSSLPEGKENASATPRTPRAASPWGACEPERTPLSAASHVAAPSASGLRPPPNTVETRAPRPIEPARTATPAPFFPPPPIEPPPSAASTSSVPSAPHAAPAASGVAPSVALAPMSAASRAAAAHTLSASLGRMEDCIRSFASADSPVEPPAALPARAVGGAIGVRPRRSSALAAPAQPAQPARYDARKHIVGVLSPSSRGRSSSGGTVSPRHEPDGAEQLDSAHARAAKSLARSGWGGGADARGDGAADGPTMRTERLAAAGGSPARAWDVCADADALDAAAAAKLDADDASTAALVPTLLGDGAHAVALEGWVTKLSDHLHLPRRRWLVVTEGWVCAYEAAHGYLLPRSRGADGRAAAGRAAEGLAPMGGRPTMALALRDVAALPLPHTPTDFVLLPLEGPRKVIRAGDAHERDLWLLAIRQGACAAVSAPLVFAPPVLAPCAADAAGAAPAAASPRAGDGSAAVLVRRALLPTPVGHVHVVSMHALPGAGTDDGSELSDACSVEPAPCVPPIVCVHAAGGSAASFGALGAHLAELAARRGTARRIVAVDLPGCGHSDAPPPPPARESLLAGGIARRPSATSVALQCALDALASSRERPARRRPARAMLLARGFSGALGALSLAAAQPERVCALVLAQCRAPRGSAPLLRALAASVVCPVLLLDVGGPGGAEEGLGAEEAEALRSFGYCRRVHVARGGDPVAARDAWVHAVLAHAEAHARPTPA